MYLPSQGFKYELEPPIEVEVLEGKLEGELEEPIEDLMEIPGKEYPVPQDFLEKPDAGVSEEASEAQPKDDKVKVQAKDKVVPKIEKPPTSD